MESLGDRKFNCKRSYHARESDGALRRELASSEGSKHQWRTCARFCRHATQAFACMRSRRRCDTQAAHVLGKPTLMRRCVLRRYTRESSGSPEPCWPACRRLALAAAYLVLASHWRLPKLPERARPCARRWSCHPQSKPFGLTLQATLGRGSLPPHCELGAHKFLRTQSTETRVANMSREMACESDRKQ